MTTSQLILITSLDLAAFVGVAYFNRAKVPRIAGALCGGAVFGVVTLLAVAIGETRGWWRVPKCIPSMHTSKAITKEVSQSCARRKTAVSANRKFASTWPVRPPD